MYNINVLLVEDDTRIRTLIKKYLLIENYSVKEAVNGAEAIEEFESSDIDIVILDIMMPFIDGYEVLRHIRSVSDVPVILLTAKSLEEDKVKGFELGVDDYITKPFSVKELVLRVKALLKRSDKLPAQSIELDGLTIDIPSFKVSYKDRDISLTKKEFDCLYLLVVNANQVLSRDQIIDNIWGMDYDKDSRNVDTLIKRLRKKLGDFSEHIITVRGYGYRLNKS